ncbi:MAG: transposase [Janthinobacterium lividum]
MKDSPPPAKHRRYDAALRAEALRLASESRSTQAAARALNISPKLLYKWQKETLTPVSSRPWGGIGLRYGGRTAPVARLGSAADPGAGHFKKAIAIFSTTDTR